MSSFALLKVRGGRGSHYLRSEGGGGTPYNGLYWEVLTERTTFFRLQVYKDVGILQDEFYEI